MSTDSKTLSLRIEDGRLVMKSFDGKDYEISLTRTTTNPLGGIDIVAKMLDQCARDTLVLANIPATHYWPGIPPPETPKDRTTFVNRADRKQFEEMKRRHGSKT